MLINVTDSLTHRFSKQSSHLAYLRLVSVISFDSAQIAHFAFYPPKWQADVRELSAELIFLCGGRLGGCRRNDTDSADHSASATAMQFVHVAAVVAIQKTQRKDAKDTEKYRSKCRTQHDASL